MNQFHSNATVLTDNPPLKLHTWIYINEVEDRMTDSGKNSQNLISRTHTFSLSLSHKFSLHHHTTQTSNLYGWTALKLNSRVCSDTAGFAAIILQREEERKWDSCGRRAIALLLFYQQNCLSSVIHCTMPGPHLFKSWPALPHYNLMSCVIQAQGHSQCSNLAT